jgi:hypothetical protein
MILPSILVVFAAAIAGLYWHLRKQPDRRSLWRRTLQIGLGVGLARAGLASWGWYTVEHTGGPLQIPAFALAMLAWPEAALFLAERRTTAVPPEFYVQLSVLLIAGTLVLVGAVALAVRRSHTPFRLPPT